MRFFYCKIIIVWLLFFVFFLSCKTSKIAKPFTTNDDAIIKIWEKDSVLKWTDFQGLPSQKEIWNAVTNAFIAYQIVDKKQVTIFACVDRTQSWHVDTRPDLLRHEQYHFNIVEWFARQMRKAVFEQKIKPTSQIFKTMYGNQMNSCNEMQRQYDAITEHGKNKAEQLVQEKIIDDSLNALQNYTNSLVQIDAKK